MVPEKDDMKKKMNMRKVQVHGCRKGTRSQERVQGCEKES